MDTRRRTTSRCRRGRVADAESLPECAARAVRREGLRADGGAALSWDPAQPPWSQPPLLAGGAGEEPQTPTSAAAAEMEEGVGAGMTELSPRGKLVIDVEPLRQIL